MHFDIEQAKIKRNPSIPEDTRGVINLTINYDPNAGILTVRLIEVMLNNANFIINILWVDFWLIL